MAPTCAALLSFLGVIAGVLSQEPLVGISDRAHFTRTEGSSDIRSVDGAAEAVDSSKVLRWEIIIQTTAGDRWTSLVAPKLQSVLSDLRVEQRFERFYCDRIKKTTAPCDARTWTNPRGPIAVLPAAGQPKSNPKATKVRDVVEGARTIVKMLVDFKIERLPAGDVLDTPLKTYIEQLQHARQSAIQLHEELDRGLDVADERIELVSKSVDALRSGPLYDELVKENSSMAALVAAVKSAADACNGITVPASGGVMKCECSVEGGEIKFTRRSPHSMSWESMPIAYIDYFTWNLNGGKDSAGRDVALIGFVSKTLCAKVFANNMHSGNYGVTIGVPRADIEKHVAQLKLVLTGHDTTK